MTYYVSLYLLAQYLRMYSIMQIQQNLIA